MVNPNTGEMITPASLQDVKLLKCFNSQELDLLIRAGELLDAETNTNIVIEGELSWGLYVIVEGTVGILKANKMTGEVYEVCHLGRQSHFGEMSLVDDQPRSATVRALIPTTLFHIDKVVFQKILDSRPEMKIRFLENCVQDLVHRLRDVDENYVVSQYQLWKSAMQGRRAA
jgi:CRP-like cAMP-binding protein